MTDSSNTAAATGTASAGKRSYHHGDLHEALLLAAEQLLAERGAAGFTLRACARAADVSHAAPAHHFGDSAGLLAAVAARGFLRMEQQVAEAVSAAGADPTGQLVAVCRAYVRFAWQQPELFRVMFRVDKLDRCADVLVSAASGTFVTLTNSILAQRGEQPIARDELSGAFSNEDMTDDVLVGWCHVHGMAHLLTEGQLDDAAGGDVEAFIERTARSNGRLLAQALQRRAKLRRDQTRRGQKRPAQDEVHQQGLFGR